MRIEIENMRDFTEIISHSFPVYSRYLITILLSGV